MGQLLEKAIRRKGLNITEIAAALQISRRTLYNWFKLEVIDEVTMERIANVTAHDFTTIQLKPINGNNKTETTNTNSNSTVKDEAYWQDRYIDLLERYSQILAAQHGLDKESRDS